MATRSRIGVELENGIVKSVYCHWDGYPTGVGRDLLNCGFENRDQVEEFINEGSRSTVDTSYHAWRGEDIVVKESISDENYFNTFNEEYAYLYTLEGKWVVKPYSGRVCDLEKLLQ